MKKILALVIAMMLVLGMVSAFAATQTVAATPADDDNATITVNNPAKGETYKVFKLFDATVSGSGDAAKIAYQCTGDIPAGLTSFFTKDANNNVIPADSICEKDNDGKITGTKMTDELKAALETWAASATAAAEAESDGKEALEFTSLPYGYYVMTTTHKPDGENAKAAITVTSTKPNASIYDKNSNEPSAKKEVKDESYSVGDTIEYTGTFDTTNFMGEGEDAKQVVDYVIEDTLPEYLSDVTITSITIGGTAMENAPTAFTDKKITIPWATKDTTVTPAKFTSLYDQGAQIVIKYTATLTKVTNINAADKNTIKITPEVDNDNGDKKPWDESWEDDADITTYAAALKKTDGTTALAGAKFAFNGLTVEPISEGVYQVLSYDATSTTPGTEMEVDSKGMLYILGLKQSASLTGKETQAPVGYNQLTDDVTLTPQDLEKEVIHTSGSRKYDADGNLVSETSTTGTSKTVTRNLEDLDAEAVKIVNKKGVELPSTGGIGTTIFYVAGSILVLAAVVLLVTKRRMNAGE